MPFPKPPPAKPHPTPGRSRRGSQTPSLQANWLLPQGQSEDGGRVSRTPARGNGHLQLCDPEPVWEPTPAPPRHEATGHRGSRKGKPLVGGRAGSRQGLEEKKRLEEAQTVNKY